MKNHTQPPVPVSVRCSAGLDRTAGRRLVLVEWLDSHYRSGWTTEAATPKPLTCLSVGWIIARDRNGLTLASHLTDEDEAQRCGEMTIPLKAIVRTEELT